MGAPENGAGLVLLAMVSHELRTPLATVRGSGSTLLDESSAMHPSEVREFHRIIFEQTDRLYDAISARTPPSPRSLRGTPPKGRGRTIANSGLRPS